ncbi:ribonuclease H-like domain-containing protein [Tanacetum coccineum]
MLPSVAGQFWHYRMYRVDAILKTLDAATSKKIIDRFQAYHPCKNRIEGVLFQAKSGWLHVAGNGEKHSLTNVSGRSELHRRSHADLKVVRGNFRKQRSHPRNPRVESDYMRVANSVVETVLLSELHSPLHYVILVYYDNVIVIHLTVNPVRNLLTKHIEIDIHFVPDMVAQGQIRVLHVSSCYQYVDIFTKGLLSTLFEKFRTSLTVRYPPAPTARECRR